MVTQKPTKKTADQPRKKTASTSSGTKSHIPASTKDLTAAHWKEMNKAVTRLSVKNVNAICELAPSLTPWKGKGLLIKLIRQLMRTAAEGGAASKEMDEEDKSVKAESGAKDRGGD